MLTNCVSATDTLHSLSRKRFALGCLETILVKPVCNLVIGLSLAQGTNTLHDSFRKWRRPFLGKGDGESIELIGMPANLDQNISLL
jgi:hypothetical protein